MTKLELHILEKELDQILEVIELCDSKWDADIVENLDRRLQEITEILQQDIRIAKIRESKLKVAK